MQRSTKLQITLASAGILLVVALLFANTTPPPVTNEMAMPSKGGIAQLVDSEKGKLNGVIASRVQQLEARLNEVSEEESIVLLDSLLRLMDAEFKPLLAAHYAERKSELAKGKENDNWFQTARRFHGAVALTAPEQRQNVYQKAIEAYEKALQESPENLDIKTALAVCYVEGSGAPMNGISMLKEVLAADPDNINALLNMGLFAVKSGQLDKAIPRFTKILAVDSTYIEAYLYLADCYEKKHELQKAVKNYEHYEQRVKDEELKTEVRNYINKLSSRES